MKFIYYSIIYFIIVNNISLHASVYTVDNNPNSSATYSLLQDAINAASSGDTIYVMGSPYTYDNTSKVRINKANIVIIGPGYFLGNNPKTQVNNISAKIYEMEIGQGADNVVIMGLDFNYSKRVLYLSDNTSTGADGSIGPQNLLIKRNKIFQLYFGVSSSDNSIAGIYITQNYFESTYNPVYIYTPNAANITFLNNIVYVTNTSYAAVYSYANIELSNSIFQNNTFTNGFYQVHGVEISNNIFTLGNLNNCSNNDILNNVLVNANTTGGSSAGNTESSNLNGVALVGLLSSDSPGFDSDFMLGASSPAIGAGIDGIDAGAFGGGTSYILSGIPPIPTVYQLSTSGYGTAQDGMSVTISVKSNQ